MITEATHIDLSEIVEAVKFINPKECYLVHINDEELLKNKIVKLSADNKYTLKLTYDGMRVILP